MYFGSVRFFKNLILLCVIILIAIPTVLAVRFGTAPKRQEAQVAELSGEVEQLQAQIKTLEADLELALSAAQKEAEEPVVQEPVEQPEEPAVTDETPPFIAEAPSYQALYPDFYAPQPLGELTREEGVIYLTFDDGPSSNTDRVLEVLAQNDVKATFFVNGTSNEAGLERMREVVAQGHTLGMHSYTHRYEVIYDSVEAYLDDMYQLFVLIRDTTGQTPTCFRFPGGSINGYNKEIYQELIAEMLRRGFIPYDWNISAQDATNPMLSVDEVLDNVFSTAAGKNGGIVLMHDGSGQVSTAQALDTIIKRLLEQGFTLDCIHPDTMPVLLSYKY